MRYSITIGEKIKENGRVSAQGVKLKDAPAFGEPTDYTNSRCPGYVQWDKFLNFVGEDLRRLMFEGLMPKHPGFKRIKPEHYIKLKSIITEFKSKYPNAIPSYATDKEEDGAMVRLTWLEYWIKWALENCKTPIFYNS